MTVKHTPKARPTFATCKRFARTQRKRMVEKKKMFTGLLGAAMLVGFIAGGVSFSASGSLLIALLVYSLSGTCVMLAAMLYVALRTDFSEEQSTPSERERLREAA